MTPRTIVSFCLFAFLLTLPLPLLSFAKDPATLMRVVDGDTIEVKLNDQKEKVRLLSVYTTKAGEKLWVIAEADRRATTLLLPQEY